MSGIDTALDEMATILTANTDATAYATPPESLPDVPCFVLEWLNGTMTMATVASLSQDTLTCLAALYTSRVVLPAASSSARYYIADVRDALYGNVTLSSTSFTITEIRFTGPGGVDYNGQQYYGIRFEIDILFKEDVTFSG